MKFRFPILTLAAVFICQIASAAIPGEPAIRFNRDIRPIFSENCFACHGPDGNKRKAGLRLDEHGSATAKLKSGDTAIVPGKPGESKLLKLVSAHDPGDRMPPEKTGKTLTKPQIGMITAWIQQGALFEKHWAYIEPERPGVPAVQDKTWPKNEIDRFILARLEKEKLTPSEPAAKETLIRRVSYDLTGLPPTIEELDAYLSDQSNAAYEKVVDRLLESKHYGEKMATHWLDLARFADSDGYHSDNPRSMWQYRDWVINAFNKNMPFDQFTIEQIAGDLLPDAKLDQKIATAFSRNGMTSTEGGADPDEYMFKYVTDRVTTFGTVWLGTSINCTECHDHKYDPFTQKEFYQIYDFFNRIPEKGLDSDPAPPFVKVPSREQQKQLDGYRADTVAFQREVNEQLETPNRELDAKQSLWERELRNLVFNKWKLLKPAEMKARSGAALRVENDETVHVSGNQSEKDEFTLSIPNINGKLAALRLEALPDGRLPQGGVSRDGSGNFVLSDVIAEVELPAGSQSLEKPELSSWKMLGPFAAPNANDAFTKAFIPEAAVDLNAAYLDGKLKWVEKADFKDGATNNLAGDNSATYLYRTLTVRKPRLMAISLGSDDGLAVWLNGKKLLANNISRAVGADQDKLILNLRTGENKLLLKVVNGSGGYAFYFAPNFEPVTRYAIPFASALADYSQKDFSIANVLDGKPETGWAVDGHLDGKRVKRQVMLILREPVELPEGSRLVVRLQFDTSAKNHVLGHFRLAMSSEEGVRNLITLPPLVQTAFFKPGATLLESDRSELRKYYRLEHSAQLKEVNAKLALARKNEAELIARIPTIRVMEDMPKGRDTFIRVRGDYRNIGEKVAAGVPGVLPKLPEGAPKNRLTLAKWLVDPRHPLTSRVTVNRFWAVFFGNGIVKTGNEFGSQGEAPSHPELLDWLAREFIGAGWNIKAMHKLMVMSATYQQSSAVNKTIQEKDPFNSLLSRAPRLRLPAETIRDSALAYAGLLDRNREPGGPSVRPYQPPGLWEEMMFGGNKYEPGKADELYRRSLYTLWKRTVPYPMFKTFDAPDRAICTEQRGITTTPLQAFVTLNEKTFIEAAALMAQRIILQGGADFESRLKYAFRLAVGRVPTEKERGIISGIYGELSEHYQRDLQAAIALNNNSDKKPENMNQIHLAAWTAVSNLILNLDETITRE